MVDTTGVKAKEIEARQNIPIVFDSGMDQETSKFVVLTGSLSDSLNYVVTTKGYTRASGLWLYDGTTDSSVYNMWVLGIDDTEATLIGGPTYTRFTLGGQVTWGTTSRGTAVYYSRVGGAPDYTMLGLIDVFGPLPVSGNTVLDVESDTQWIIGTVVDGCICELATATNPITGDLIAGTVTDYLTFINDTVNAALVAQTAVTTVDGALCYHGAVPGTGAITGGWQFEDDVYVVRDTYAARFSYGENEIKPGDTVIVPYTGGTETVVAARVTLTGGEWTQGTAAGHIVFMPGSATTDFRNLDDITTSGGVIQLTGPINAATMTTATALTGGLIWKGTIHGWTWVDAGYTLGYSEGANAPNVSASPLFLPDLIDASRSSDTPDSVISGGNPVVNGADAVVATGTRAVSSATSVGSAPYITWTSPSNVLLDDETYTTCSLNSGQTSRTLTCVIPANIVPQDDVKILGVTVKIQAIYTGSYAPIDSVVRLVNTATAPETYQSDNRARRTALTTPWDVSSVYGGETDTWGIENISVSDLNDGLYSIQIEYTNTTAGTGQVEIDYVSVGVTYVPNTEKVWFRDGVTDVSTGVIHAFQIESGDFGDYNDAAGTMSFTDISAPTEIGVGMEMYSGAYPTGVSIGNVASSPKYNLLPSAAVMEPEDLRYQTVVHNYYENDAAEAVYGVTGASSAFAFDGESFTYLKTPLLPSVDKPRHIAPHDNRLALGFGTGHVVLSAVGVPNDFSGVDGASSWGVGDSVTGLLELQGNVLGVFSEASIRTIEGSSAEDGQARVISSSTGCREYTLQNVIGPYFVDNRGVSSIETSANYGDFSMNRVTDPIKTWIQDRIQSVNSISRLNTTPCCSVAVRNKNQYRVYFNDGYSLVLYWRTDGKVACTIMHYDPAGLGTAYVPTFINSTVLSTGKERIVMGCANGKVWIIDGAEAIFDNGSVTSPDCYIVVNPINFGAPDRAHKLYHVEVQGQFYGAQTVEAWADTNYSFEETGAAQHTMLFGDYSSTPIFTSKNEIDSGYMPILADGYSVKLKTTMDGSLPHTFQSMLYRASSKGIDRNRTSKTY